MITYRGDCWCEGVAKDQGRGRLSHVNIDSTKYRTLAMSHNDSLLNTDVQRECSHIGKRSTIAVIREDEDSPSTRHHLRLLNRAR